MKSRSPLWLHTEKLLLQGGDERLALTEDGRNKYGCTAGPDGLVAAFGSSTASSISEAAFAAADRLRRQLLVDSLERKPGHLYRRECARIRTELKQLCGVADMPGLEVILAASGTDLHLLAAQYTAAASEQPPLVVMMEASETGSGVAAALQGRHFGSRTAQGREVTAGAPIDGARATQVAQVKVRDVDGAPRAQVDVEAEIEALAAHAVAAGRRVLLVGLDQSKTGLLVPAPAFLARMRRRWPEQLDVLIDACQFRLANPTLHRYLAEGFLLAVTGSKFFTGPSFCGALFVPPPIAASWSGRSIPPALQTGAPGIKPFLRMRDAAAADDRANFGLLLRWEAALEEMRRWSQVRPTAARGFLDAVAAAVRERLDVDPVFERLHVPPLDRGVFSDPAGWDGVQTIFPFLLHHVRDGEPEAPLSRLQTNDFYRSLANAADASGCQLGQPVACGHRDSTPVSALRLCLSARLIVEATSGDGTRADAVIQRAVSALDQVARRIRALSPSPHPIQHV